jgi:hypothetical protein
MKYAVQVVGWRGLELERVQDFDRAITLVRAYIIAVGPIPS